MRYHQSTKKIEIDKSFSIRLKTIAHVVLNERCNINGVAIDESFKYMKETDKSVSGLVGKNLSSFISVLWLNKSVCHQVVLVTTPVTKSENSSVLADESTTNSSTTELCPLTEIKLTMLEMAKETSICCKDSQNCCSWKSKSQCNIVPSSFCGEEFLLV